MCYTTRMNHAYAVQKIAEGIFAVGAVDKDATRFHGYHVNRGVTYNAYLVAGNNGKFTLIDTVHESRTEELMNRIAAVTDVKNIEALIVNHTEPDHSGAVPVVVAAAHPRIYATPAAAKLLQSLYNVSGVTTVKTGDSLEIGGRRYRFLATPMVHWPDNMVTYLPDDGILFSNDALGQHYAAEARLDTENDACIAFKEARHYFANIVMPYRKQAIKALADIKALPLKMIAPAHGVVWTKHIPDICKLYETLCADPDPQTATLVFDTLWGGTAKRAEEAENELRKTHPNIYRFDLRTAHLSDVMEALATCSHVCIGSPTYNNYPTPHISALLAEIEALRPPVKEYSVFGTFGWGGGASKRITEKMDSLGLKKTFDLTRN